MKPTKEHVITQDCVSIAFDYYARGHERLVLVAPGFYNSKDALLLKDFAVALNEDYDIILMDFRGHGTSQGLFHWTSKEYLDLLAVLEFAQNKYKGIGVIGFSLGAATTFITAAKTDMIKSIIAVSSPSDFYKIEFRLWELNFENDIQYSVFGQGRIGKGVKPGPFWQQKNKPLDIVPKLKQPIFYIHGTDDWIIYPWHSELLFKKTVSQKRIEIIPSGPHAEYLMRSYKVQVVSWIKQWFDQTL